MAWNPGMSEGKIPSAALHGRPMSLFTRVTSVQSCHPKSTICSRQKGVTVKRTDVHDQQERKLGYPVTDILAANLCMAIDSYQRENVFNKVRN